MPNTPSIKTNPYHSAANPEFNSAPRKDYSKLLNQQDQVVAADESKEISTLVIVKVSRTTISTLDKHYSC